MGRYLSILVLGLSAALTASIVPHFVDFFLALVSSITPVLNNTRGQINLVLLFVLCWSVHADLAESLIWALVGGIALDLQSILPVGTTSVPLVLMAYTVNGIAQQLFHVRLIFLIVATPIATSLLSVYSLFALAMIGNVYDLMLVGWLVIVPSVILNLLAVVPVYGTVRLMQRRLEGGLQITPQSLSAGSATSLSE